MSAQMPKRAAGLLKLKSKVVAQAMKEQKLQSKIIYTYTDEAPMLATHSFLPIIRTFTNPAKVGVDCFDISLAARVISQFPERLEQDQQIQDFLTRMGKMATEADANMIKLPNISASIPQLTECIKELQGQGYNIPDYPANPQNAAEEEIKARYGKALGSAVNPVLREGNSDRRVAAAVKSAAQARPHKLGAWSKDSLSHVSHMTGGDFFASEKSHTMPKSDTVVIEFVSANGEKRLLKEGLALQAGEVIDCSTMSCTKLAEFLQKEMQDCKEKGVLMSVHLKATMMKVSDPIMFGVAVKVYYADVFAKYGDVLESIGVNPNLGVADMISKIEEKLDKSKAKEIMDAIEAVYKVNPPLAMVDSSKGITNLHSPNDIIIDASMPCVVRDSGKMWNTDDKLQDVKCCIPDRTYATMYAQIMDMCKEGGQFDVATMGSVSNVGLMAQKAQEYGSHDKTFQMSEAGVVNVKAANGEVLMSQNVEKDDIFRMSQAKDAPIQDWIKLAVNRARLTNTPAVFWLDEERAHDREIIKKIKENLPKHDTTGLELPILKPADAMKFSVERSRQGKDTISCTGNVLRDYLTDLFPILELGTSAKMLSIVPLLSGGGLYETGAGGSAPKHVQQFVEKGHLRWDSLGEFLALAVSLEEIARKTGNEHAKAIANALHKANTKFLTAGKNPGRKPGDLCTRASHFYLCLYWAEAMSNSADTVPELTEKFTALYKELAENEDVIVECFRNAHKQAPIDIGGYFQVSAQKADAAMRPVQLFNDIIEKYQTP